MNNKLKLFTTAVIVFLLVIVATQNSYSQTEGFNVKTPIQKIADSTTKFLNKIIAESAKNPKKSIPQDLVCSSSCFLVIPEIEIVESRGDFTGSGLMACRAPNSDNFTEPLYYKINHIESFEEADGGILILATDKSAMKSILGYEVNLNSDNVLAGPIGVTKDSEMKSFVSYVKYKDQDLSGIDLSGTLIEYSSKDTFNAYQGTVVPIEILVNPQDIPPVVRDFDSSLEKWVSSCK